MRRPEVSPLKHRTETRRRYSSFPHTHNSNKQINVSRTTAFVWTRNQALHLNHDHQPTWQQYVTWELCWSCSCWLAFCNCLRGLCIRLYASWAINLMRDVRGLVQCSFSVTNWELSNWNSFFTLLLHLGQLITGSVFRRIATDWISYFGKCICNTRPTSDVLRKDFWLAC
jgi:hypothetical protein